MRTVAIIGSVAISVAMAGCAQEPPAAPIAPVKVQIVTSDYCQIMCRINPGNCLQPFSVNDHALTIERARRANRVVEQKNCASPKRTS